MADMDRINRRREALEAWKKHRKECEKCKNHDSCEEEDRFYLAWRKTGDYDNG